ncbi:MAG: DUF5069 domain-containing protein [Limnochordia bacterium]|jgi:hypothetical protein|nr:DUF5069 domain-containing protein [Bacillota bacterium]HOB09214.1 DUF5069 domain-containing protein [Limnochordia bacterium]NLH31296.1 DUF5069 domain-containing protein [Bacillota bacterium]HPT93651.1 DUF5069 domain-containing protein [Limnochordia bacterium]HPZ30075.1 DUF5069 domain-containing protein [Limnochordia bacterium]
MGFEPRDGNIALGGMPWLARMIDKARAKADGTIGDYIYPCPRDQELLKKLGLTADEFMEIVLNSRDDQEIVEKVKAGRGN